MWMTRTPRLDHPRGEPVERVVVLPEQPRERHAVQAPGMAGRRRVGVHVRVDPHQAERGCALLAAFFPAFLPQRAHHAGPGAAGAAVVAADDAGQPAAAQRVGHRGGKLAAQPADGELLAPLVRPAREDRPGQRLDAAFAKPRAHQGRQQRRRRGAARIGPAVAPGCSDHFNLSLHGYTRIRPARLVFGEQRRDHCCPSLERAQAQCPRRVR